MVVVYLFFLLLAWYLLSLLMSAFPLSFPRRRLNPEKLTVLYGGPGSGKSTYLTLEAVRALKSGYPVYSNVPIKGCFQVEISDLGKWNIPSGSLLIVDEIGSELNNRDFSVNFRSIKHKDGTVSPSLALKWWKQHRHEGVECIAASQGFDDMDKKIQTLGSDYFIVRKIPLKGFPIVYLKEIRKRPDLDEESHQPVDGFFFRKFGFRLCFGRFCWPYFDSFSRMGLPEKSWVKYGDPSGSESFEIPDYSKF